MLNLPKLPSQSSSVHHIHLHSSHPPCERTRSVRSLWNYLSCFFPNTRKFRVNFFGIALNVEVPCELERNTWKWSEKSFMILLLLIFFSAVLGQRIHSHYNLTLHNKKAAKNFKLFAEPNHVADNGIRQQFSFMIENILYDRIETKKLLKNAAGKVLEDFLGFLSQWGLWKVKMCMKSGR